MITLFNYWIVDMFSFINVMAIEEASYPNRIVITIQPLDIHHLPTNQSMNFGMEWQNECRLRIFLSRIIWRTIILLSKILPNLMDMTAQPAVDISKFHIASHVS